MSEHIEQKSLIAWSNLQSGKYPELKLLFAIPNGANMGGNTTQRIVNAKKMKSEGLRPGVPDLFLPVARGYHYGLFIEMKFDRNTLSDNQSWWLEKLQKEGYCTHVCYSFEIAKKVILEYLNS